MKFSVGDEHVEVEPEAVIVAGFTGRDRAAVDAHIRELRRLGVPTPHRVPSFYEISPALVTQDTSMVVAGPGTSGEAEIVIVTRRGRRLVTVASDHTDRDAEAIDIELSKRTCPKPMAREAWDYAEVVDHWDAMELHAWIDEDGVRTPYQTGSAEELLPLDAIEAAIPFRSRPKSWVLFMGTLPVIGSIRPTGRFAARLHDPLADRLIALDYTVTVADHLERP